MNDGHLQEAIDAGTITAGSRIDVEVLVKAGVAPPPYRWRQGSSVRGEIKTECGSHGLACLEFGRAAIEKAGGSVDRSVAEEARSRHETRGKNARSRRANNPKVFEAAAKADAKARQASKPTIAQGRGSLHSPVPPLWFSAQLAPHLSSLTIMT